MRLYHLCAYPIVLLAIGACSGTSSHGGATTPSPGDDAGTGGGNGGSNGTDASGGDSNAGGASGGKSSSGGRSGRGTGGRSNQASGGSGNAKSDAGPGSGGSGNGGSTGGAGAGGAPDPNNGNPPGCGISQPAFCETFEKESPNGRGGPLDEAVWSFSRYSHLFQYLLNRVPAGSTAISPDMMQPINVMFTPTFCGKTFNGLVPGTDIGICPGLDGAGQMSNQLNEVYNDAGDFAFNDMRVRQPFDFTGRTGTVVFDVDAKINPLNVGHGWWVEFWITEDPLPMPYHGAPTVSSYPRSALGLGFQGGNCDKAKWENSLTEVVVTKDYKILHDMSGADFTWTCFKTADAKLNRFKIMVSQSQVEVDVSDSDSPGNVRKVGTATNLGLPFSRGYIHLQHSQYNAHKDGDATPSQTYRWDNVGFDGPVLKTPRGYDVQEPRTPLTAYSGALVTGWAQPPSVSVSGVDLTGATKASLNFNIMTPTKRPLQYRFNGGAWHTFTLPATGIADDDNQMLRTYSVDAPISELVSGTNKIDFQMPNDQHGQAPAFANIDITVEVD